MAKIANIARAMGLAVEAVAFVETKLRTIFASIGISDPFMEKVLAWYTEDIQILIDDSARHWDQRKRGRSWT